MSTKVLTTTTIGDTSTSALSSLLIQKTSTFKGEKSFFVGRGEYINKIIKEKIVIPSSRVCIVGPGGYGKSQLAFKTIHEYEKEWLFDFLIEKQPSASINPINQAGK